MKEDEIMKFGERIKTLRVLSKKSQTCVSTETGIPQTTISDWENDKSEPTVSDTKKLAVALNVSVAELLDDPSNYTADKLMAF